MTLADTLLAELLPTCPVCSYRKAEHPEMLNDVLAMPMAVRGRAAGRWYLRSGCIHSGRLEPADGALGWVTRGEAEQAWRDEAGRLVGADTVTPSQPAPDPAKQAA